MLEKGDRSNYTQGLRSIKDLEPRTTNKIITPENLMEDNHAEGVRQYLEDWEIIKSEDDTTVVLGCSDPRLIVPTRGIVDLRSVAAASIPELYRSVLSDRFNPRAIIVIVHYDKKKSVPGEMPKGCGGLGAKAAQETNDEGRSEFSGLYIESSVVHPDPFIHGLFVGEEIAERSRRPVAVLTEDHLSGKPLALASFIPEGSDVRIRSAIPLRSGFVGRYNPSEIYANGIPHLEEDRIPNEFTVFWKRYHANLERVVKENPDLEKLQTENNPSVVALTKEIRPLSARFPSLLGKTPNTVFTITVPRDTREDPSTSNYSTDLMGMIRAFNQAHYPIDHALKSEGDPSKAFSNLYDHGTVLIEGGSMDELKTMAHIFYMTPHVKAWMEIGQNQIILLQTHKGYVVQTEKWENKTD